MKLRIALTCAMMMAAGRAHAVAGSDDTLRGLVCRKAVVQMELNECANREFESWDGKLNAIYRALLKNASQKEQTLLRAAERSWLSYRDSECAYETAGSEGGSIQPMNTRTA